MKLQHTAPIFLCLLSVWILPLRGIGQVPKPGNEVLVFDCTPLKLVVKAVSRKYSVKVVCDDEKVGNLFITATIGAKSSLDFFRTLVRECLGVNSYFKDSVLHLTL